jgi:hypothetical protein
MPQYLKSGGIYKDKYMVGDWTEIIATFQGVDYHIGSTKKAALTITNKIYAHRESRSSGHAVDMVVRVMTGAELRGRMEELHKENLRLLMGELANSSSQVDHGQEVHPMEFFTIHGRRPNADGTESTSVEFCLWKCRAADLIQFGSDTSYRFRFVALNDSLGDYGGSSEKPYGWIYAGGQEVTPVTCTWTAIPSSIIPSSDNAFDVGALNLRWRRLFFGQYAKLSGINPAVVTVPNISVFVDSADGNKLKYRDATGADFDLASGGTPASAAPAVYDADTDVNYPAGLPTATTDSIDIAAPSSGDEFSEGQVVRLTLVDVHALGGGDVRVQLYNDQARAECIFDQYFDLAGDLVAYLPAHFMSDGLAGDAALYADITNQTGSTGHFQLVVRVAGILTSVMSSGGVGTGVGAANARDGIAWDGIGLYTDLLTSGGLALQGVSPNKKLYVVEGRGIDVGATVALDAAVAMLLDEEQTNTVMKRFASGTLGLPPHGSTVGPPVSSGWSAGDIFVDMNLLLWRCIDAGPPCVWQFFGTSLEENIDSGISAGEDNATYTAEIACEASLDLTISVSANFGYIQKLCIWASQTAWPTGDIDQAFRILCFPNSNRLYREQLWCQPGQWRKVSLVSPMAAAVDNVAQVTSVDVGAEDDLVRLRKLAGTDAEEYARIITRDTSAVSFSLGEDVLNDYAADDPVMFVTEIVMMPFMNNDSVNPRKLFLTICNDGELGIDASVIVGYQLNLQFLGGGGSL